ncbi:uncharacterized protein LOC116260283 isoform X1 [Nymphaea colorata]|nr:uncharacterized protein LOC116260283 isoform X1 [Nymphaea colorata]
MASIASPSPAHLLSPFLPLPSLSWTSPSVIPPTLALARSLAVRISGRSVESPHGVHFGHSKWRIAYRTVEDSDLEGEGKDFIFDQAVFLFNSGDYYACHDVLEAIWNDAQEPIRTIIHGILQCAVGFHHLFNQNHRGAMMELGEGLCKLQKMNFSNGPFYQFEQEISEVQNFIYKTQLELATCSATMKLMRARTKVRMGMLAPLSPTLRTGKILSMVDNLFWLTILWIRFLLDRLIVTIQEKLVGRRLLCARSIKDHIER